MRIRSADVNSAKYTGRFWSAPMHGKAPASARSVPNWLAVSEFQSKRDIRGANGKTAPAT